MAAKGSKKKPKSLGDIGIVGGANVDLSDVDAAFARLQNKAAALKPAFKELRKPMIRDQKSHARAEDSPVGSWPPRAAATEARRKRANKTIRKSGHSRATKATLKAVGKAYGRKRPRTSRPKQLLGRLPSAYKIDIGSDFIRMTSRAEWSGVHQHGGRAGHGRKVRIPKREFFWISRTLMKATQEIFAGYILKGWKK